MEMKVRKRHKPIAEINVVPYIDVMLVLLITFLLSASSFEQSNVTVPLPRVTQVQEVEKYACVVQLDATGKVDWPEPGLEEMENPEALERLKQTREEQVLAVGIHRDCPYGRVFPVLEAAAKAGWQEVVVLTTEGP